MFLNTLSQRVYRAAGFALLLAGCGGGTVVVASGAVGTAGSAGGTCSPDGTCNGGLECVEGLCVASAEVRNPDEDRGVEPGADVDAVPGFVRIEPGTFTIGSPDGEPGRVNSETQHAVTLTRAFLLQATEVTQGDYATLMGTNPSNFADCGAECPVESVSWLDAIAYANAHSVSEGLPECYDDAGEVVGGSTVYDCVGYRLPTEAESEYAARAGTATATYAGNLTDAFCEDATLTSIAWFCGNAENQTHAVGSKAPNAWGLYDMLGNVVEWTSDWHGTYPGDVTDPAGPAASTDRVLRGGDWGSFAQGARASHRDNNGPDGSYNSVGFRLARSLP